jgi:hypothetical protein
MRWVAPVSLAINVVVLALMVSLVSRPAPPNPLAFGSLDTSLGLLRADVAELAARPAAPADPGLSEELSRIAEAVTGIRSAMADERIMDELSGVCARLDDIYSELTNITAPPGFGC